METLLHEITPWVSQYGLWIVFFGMMVEGTTMILATGILCYLGMLSPTEAFAAAVAGAILGDQLWYLLGRRYARPLLVRFPRLATHVNRLEEKVRSKGDWLAFSGRFIYSGAILFPLTLGVYRYSWKRFSLLDALGVGIWAAGGIALGALLGTGIERIFGELQRLEDLLLAILLVGLGAWQLRRFFSRRRRDAQ